MTIGSRIKQERIRRGLTQEKLAGLCGYKGKAAISKIENAGDRISSKKVRLVADALGVSVPYLCGWTSRLDAGSLSPEEDSLLAAYRSAPENRKEAIRALLGLE